MTSIDQLPVGGVESVTDISTNDDTSSIVERMLEGRMDV